MLLELSQLAFTVCKEDFFFFFFFFSFLHLFRVQYLDICLVSFFFSLVFWVPDLHHRSFPSDCTVSIVEYLCFCLSFSFSSFTLYLSFVSPPPFFFFFFLNILIHVCLAYGKSRAEKCLTALSLHLQCFFPPVLYTLVFYSLTGWLFLFVFGCFVYILQLSVGRVLWSKNSKNEQLNIKQFVYLVYPVSQRGIFGCSLRDN